MCLEIIYYQVKRFSFIVIGIRGPCPTFSRIRKCAVFYWHFRHTFFVVAILSMEENNEKLQLRGENVSEVFFSLCVVHVSSWKAQLFYPHKSCSFCQVLRSQRLGWSVAWNLVWSVWVLPWPDCHHPLTPPLTTLGVLRSSKIQEEFVKIQEFKVCEFQELSELKVTFTCVLQRAFTYTSELVNYTSVLFTYF